MTAKKSFLIILRMGFLLFSLQFLRDAFYKWDGYSYYMRFIDFLPDLSLAFILWTFIGAIIAVALWLIVYGLSKIIPKSFIPIRFEHIMTFFIFIVLPLLFKRTFYDFSISGFIGLSRSTILIIGVVLIAVIVWFGRKHIEELIDRMLYGIDSRITPVVWLFAILLVIAVPFSVSKKSFSDTKYTLEDSENAVSRKEVGTNRSDRPNIVLVIMDSLYARDMQLYGYERPTTPFISEWAKDAIIFSKAYASSNFTSPATMSLLTGQRVWTHKIWYMPFEHPVGNYENNLPRVLKDNGYAVYGFVQNGNAHPITLGIQNAFLVKDNYLTFHIPKKFWYSKFKNFFPNRPIVNKWIFYDSFIAKRIIIYTPEVYKTTKPSEMVYNRFLDHISRIQRRTSHRPFFAYLHVMPPHYTYLPSKPYMGLFGDAVKFNSDEEQARNFTFDAEYDPDRQAEVDILRKRYDEFILYSDKQFELFLTRLAKIVDMSNTIIMLSSDHGESFSHGWLAHVGPHLYEPLVHVPLVIKMPGETKGKIIDMPIEQIDIAPTVLELAGIPVPEWMEGRSVLPLLVDVKRSSLKPRPIFSMQFFENRALGHPITKGTIAVWDGDYKLIYYLKDKKSLLFKLRSDSGETQNIFNEKPEIAQRLKKLIDDNLSRANARITQTRKK